MKGKVVLLFLMLALFSVSLVYASPVNLPTGISSKEGALLTKQDRADMMAGSEEDVDLSASLAFDHISKRKMKYDSPEAQGNFYEGKLTVTLIDIFDIYGLFGGVSDAEYKFIDRGSDDVEYNLENQYMWGVGLSAIVFELEDSEEGDTGFTLFVDGNYRSVRDIDIESATINGAEVQESDLLYASAEWQEWQLAIGVSKKFKYFIPYAGVKYSDVKAEGKATYLGTKYDMGDNESKDKVGPFVGVSIVPTNGFSIDLQGRFVDEEAYSVSATLKF